MNALRAALVGSMVLALHGCGSSDDDATVNASDTLTRAQRDSIVSQLPIPGAGGVGAALRARDAAGARAAAHDSIGG
ncbi:MAG: hypothetical protein WD995_02125 [Gemmatimonadota bacterium]